jgi:hypothetical protein
MKTTTNSISVDINKHEALSLINALQAGIKNEFKPGEDEEAACKFLQLLRGNFQSSTRGINYTD